MTDVIARFAVGNDSCDDGLGTLIVRQIDEGNFEVFVNGGTLPSGDERATFCTDEEAVGFAVDIIKQNWRSLLHP